jgi:restriction endonuclease S subunit
MDLHIQFVLNYVSHLNGTCCISSYGASLQDIGDYYYVYYYYYLLKLLMWPKSEKLQGPLE